MGRKKITIAAINNNRLRRITFKRRHQGLLKKGQELAVLCNCEVGIVVRRLDSEEPLYWGNMPKSTVGRLLNSKHLNELESDAYSRVDKYNVDRSEMADSELGSDTAGSCNLGDFKHGSKFESLSMLSSLSMSMLQDLAEEVGGNSSQSNYLSTQPTDLFFAPIAMDRSASLEWSTFNPLDSSLPIKPFDYHGPSEAIFMGSIHTDPALLQ